MPLLPDFLLLLLLVFVRVGGVFVAAPFFGMQNIPVRLKVLLAMLLAYTLTFMLPAGLPPHALNAVGFMYYVGIEAVTGLLLGYAAQFVFFAVQFAGDIIGFQIGLSMAQAYNPIDGHSANPIGRLLSMTTLLVFVAIDGHHVLLEALYRSFEIVPLAGARLAEGGLLLQEWTRAFFMTALRLASPFMITIFLVDAALGIFSRVVPQADLFSLSLPVKLMVGFLLLYLVLQTLLPVFPTLFAGTFEDLLTMLETMMP